MSHLDYEINKELGECYLFMGDLEKAEEYYQKAASSNGVHPDPYLGLATIAVHRGHLDAALHLYEKAADIQTDDKSLSGMALCKSEMGMEEEAFGHFAAALEKNPENMIALYGIIRLGHALNRLNEVIPHLESYLELDPHKHEIRFSLAGCKMSLGENGDARQHLERIVEADPENDAARQLLDQLREAA
ncbi:tetratricopeptide repeat protein [Desulfohalovibrio reitneri]|uniref:tetratricopeptide repeat protein n=1 Tax=Desulfohalovibrio reitneri TaxID=1307759 RepID=UPI0004A6F022|nr:tetratricopeptide repeat protein [Desulfohalovibrio reitneri]